MLIDGNLKTVCNVNLSRDSFLGLTLFGDSFCSGTKLVQLAIIKKAMPVIN